jgi:hypothetical protein
LLGHSSAVGAEPRSSHSVWSKPRPGVLHAVSVRADYSFKPSPCFFKRISIAVSSIRQPSDTPAPDHAGVNVQSPGWPTARTEPPVKLGHCACRLVLGPRTPFQSEGRGLRLVRPHQLRADRHALNHPTESGPSVVHSGLGSRWGR